MTDVDKMLDQLRDAVTPVVQHIEQSIPTTANHYGDYVTAISKVAEWMPVTNRSPSLYLAIGVAMQRAGGNRAGIHSALRVMGKL